MVIDSVHCFYVPCFWVLYQTWITHWLRPPTCRHFFPYRLARSYAVPVFICTNLEKVNYRDFEYAILQIQITVMFIAMLYFLHYNDLRNIAHTSCIPKESEAVVHDTLAAAIYHTHTH
jgi:hypothetical protein